MRRSSLLLILTIFFSPSIDAVSATPWLTGPILAPAGHTIPRGHTNFEMYALDIFANGRFDEFGRFQRFPLFRTFLANPILTHGFTDWMDVQWVAPYVVNDSQGQTYHRLGDVSSAIGFQFLEQKKSTWKPDLRVVIQETFPTGRFERLDVNALGTDDTGLGAYQTMLAFNFQRLNKIKSHFLRTRLSLSGVYFSPVRVHGLNSFGGDVNTDGTVDSSFEYDAILAFEFTLTQHWVAVMEGYISQGGESRFNGVASISGVSGPVAPVGSGAFYEEALTPAIEYNFTPGVGLIAGLWFPVRGKNTPNYMTYVVALNAYW